MMISRRAKRPGDRAIWQAQWDSLRKAAEQGDALSQALLGDTLDKAEFNEEAVGYFRKSAEQGNADGQLGLGAMLLPGRGRSMASGEALA